MTKIQELARKRLELAELTAKRDEAYSAMSQTSEGITFTGLKETCSEVAKQVSQLEFEYRDQCVADYVSTGNKEQPGGQIKIYQIVEYNEASAIEWAITHNHSTLLKLNKSPFEKVAKELALNFVDFKEDPRMFISSDLSEFIESNDEVSKFIESNSEPDEPEKEGDE